MLLLPIFEINRNRNQNGIYIMLNRIFVMVVIVMIFHQQFDSVTSSASSSSSSIDNNMLYSIRHGRSRVRHSNEKDHIRWGLQAFDNLTLVDYDIDSFDNDTTLINGTSSNNNNNSNGNGGIIGGSNSGSILFGSDLWALTDNISYFNQIFSTQKSRGFRLSDEQQQQQSESTTSTSTTSVMPQLFSSIPTHKKLRKKKIMENIKKNVDKGLEYLKSHQNLDEENLKIYNNPVSIVYSNSNSNGNSNSNSNNEEEFGYQNDGGNKNIADHQKTNTYRDSFEYVNVQLDTQQQKQQQQQQYLPSFHSNKDLDTITNNNNNHDDIYKSHEIVVDNSKLQIHNNNDDQQQQHQQFNDDDDEQLYHINKPKHLASTSNNILNDDSDSGVFFNDNTNIDITNINNDIGDFGGDGRSSSNAGSNNNDDEQILMEDVNVIQTNIFDDITEEDLLELDETSRNNRLDLMKGRDVVTKFLQIVETQHLLGANCKAGTALNLGEGVVDRYAQDRFRIEAEVAVNRANMLTSIFKNTSPSVQSSEHLLHASVLSMVAFDDDIFAAGHCFDWDQHPLKSGLFCPFAYRLPSPDQGASLAKDLAAEYDYLGNTSEWFFQARKNAERVIARNDQYIKAFHLYLNHTERDEDEILAVKYEDGRWSKPYYDCGGGNIWMLTYTVPFFGYDTDNSTYFFKGTSGIDIDLRRVDIDQCPQRNTPGVTQPLNIFAGTDKCKQRTTMCEAISGLGFRRGSYKCICRKGFYYPDTITLQKYFNGSLLEEEYEKLMQAANSTYNKPLTYECLPCAEGCDYCEDASPCVAALNWPMRTSILVLACAVIGFLPPAAWFTFRYQQVKVVRAASPALLRVIALGAFFIYCTTIVMYPHPSLYTCTARIWLREIGFSLTYGALMLKTWRISVIFRVRSAKAVKITDAALLKRLGVICGVIGACLLVRTIVSPPEVVVGRTADDLKAFLCRTDWWDYTFTSMEVLFLAWGVRLCIMVRKAPSEFNESRFISMAIYNEFLLTCFLNVSMLFLQSPANPDLLFIIFFCHTQLTVTLLLGLIFGSKVYIVLRSGKSQEAIALGAKSSGAKFNFRPQIRTFANPSTSTSTAQMHTADTKLSDQEALEEIRQLSIQLQRIQESAPPKGIAVMTISSLLDGLKMSTQQFGTTKLLTTNASINGGGMALLAPPPPSSSSQQPQNIILNHQIIQKFEKSINTILCGDELIKKLNNDNDDEKLCENCLKKFNCKKKSSCSNQTSSSPNHNNNLSFSNLQLDCMCSQSDELDDDDTNIRQQQINNHHHHNSIKCNRNNDKMGKEMSTMMSIRRNKCHSSNNLIQMQQLEIKESLQLQQTSSSTCSNLKNFDTIFSQPTTSSTATTTTTKNSLCDKINKNNENFLICDKCKKILTTNSINNLYMTGSRTGGEESDTICSCINSDLNKPSSNTHHHHQHKKKLKQINKKKSNLTSEMLNLDSNLITQYSGGGKNDDDDDDGISFHSTDDSSCYDDKNILSDTTITTVQKTNEQKLKNKQSSNSGNGCYDDGGHTSKATTTITSDIPATSGEKSSRGSSSSSNSSSSSSSSNTNCSNNVKDSAADDAGNGSDGGSGGGGGKKTRNRKKEKLVLDLNDRSKYTKEVSV